MLNNLFRNPHVCRVPWGLLTVGSQGEIRLCCGSDVSGAHISEINDLNNWFNDNYMNQIRDTFTDNKWPKECKHCRTAVKEGWSSLRDTKKFKSIPVNKVNNKFLITSLEFTPSNLCNQTCAMCGSIFSSQWLKYDRQAVNNGLAFRTENLRVVDTANKSYQMPDSDFQKILKIMESVESLTLKGGEPFVDPRNLQIINHIIKNNFSLKRLEITSNIHSISDTAWKMLTELKENGCEICIVCSLDGRGKTYEWIRSTPFDITYQNLKKGVNFLGKESFVALISPTIFNFFDVEEDTEFWINSQLVNYIDYTFVAGPYYVSPKIFPNTIIMPVKDSFQKNITINSFDVAKHNFLRIKHDPQMDEKEKMQNTKSWINYVNSMRKFDILEHQPALKHFINNI